jgi:hypothetical protein
VFHITINGRPLCEHTACKAGQDDAAGIPGGRPTCGQGDERGAMRAAQAWKAANPRHAVAVVIGACPLAEEA